jgi:hypothetical protein
MPKDENRASMKGEAKVHKQGGSAKVANIEQEHHAGEKGRQGGVVFKIPKGLPDHSDVMSTPECK